MRFQIRFVARFLVLMSPSFLFSENVPHWPQFRGPNATGIAEQQAAPVEFGPGKHLLWSQTVPPGHSSPAIWGNRVFLTGFDKDNRKLELICLSRETGTVLWRQAIAAAEIEKVHQVSSPASATPVVDGERVITYFGSSGLAAFDFEGKQQWTLPLSIPKTRFGIGTSPIIAGDLLILNRADNEEGYLLAVDRRSGKIAWKQAYSATMGRQAESYSTPVIWKDQIILHRAGVIDAYDLKDGKRRWWLNAATTGTSTAVSDKDTIYVASWFPFGEADQMVPLPDFTTLIKQYDKNGDNQISESEFPADMAAVRRPDTPDVPGATIFVKPFFKAVDQNKDGLLQEVEWKLVGENVAKAKIDHGVLAFKPAGEGDVTASVVWREKTAIPEVPSPLLYENRLYLVRNGGIVTCLDAQSGKLIYRARVGAGGPYYSSPIAVGSKIYVASGEGTIVVLSAGDNLNVLARNSLGEEIFSTPAVAAGTLYVRTVRQLYAFGGK